MTEKKVVIITGSSGGIGQALARTFAEAGYGLGLWDVAISDCLPDFLTGGKVPFLMSAVDITQWQSVEKAAREILEKFGRVDVLINNAGITRDKLFLRMEEEDWDRVLAVNLKGAFICSKVIGKIMYSRKAGRIVNIASVIGQIGNIGQANYAASKAGLIALTKTLAREFARAGINVNAIAPGFIETKMTASLPPNIKEEMLKRIPLGRFGQAQDVATVALFLCSDLAGYITGQVIRVDGGLVM